MWLGHFDLNKNKANKQRKEFQGFNIFKKTYVLPHIVTSECQVMSSGFGFDLFSVHSSC